MAGAMSGERLELLKEIHGFTWDQEEWFLPLAKALEGIGPAEAAWQPPGGGNSIWQILRHLNYYNERDLRRLTVRPEDAAPPNNTATFADPGDPADAEGWRAAVAKAHEIAEGFTRLLAELPDRDPAQPLARGTLGERLPVLPHIFVHNAYHTGQIVMLRKMQQAWPATREY